MADGNGREARLDRAERDIAELFDRVNANSEKLAVLPFLREDLREVKASCAETEKALDQISSSNREYLDKKLTENRQSDEKKSALSVTKLGIIISAAVGLLAIIVGAIASLVSAGAL